jgi:ribosomal protein S6
MPLFHTILTAKGATPPASLTKLLRVCANEIVSSNGVVRSVENHGIRQLPYRFKARHANKDGERYYEQGRFISIRFDASPQIMLGVERIIRLDEDVLRYTTLRNPDFASKVNVMKLKKNPFVLDNKVPAAEATK